MSSLKNYIIDLDGTILNSSNEVLKCFREAFQNVGYNYEEKNMTSNLIGPPLREIMLGIAPELEEDDAMMIKIIEEFRKLYDYEPEDCSEFYDGIFEWLKDSKGRGIRLFIATLKPTLPTERIVKQYGLDMFEDVYTIDKFGEHITKSQMISHIIEKYNLDKDETVMIGDSAGDMKSAKDCGIKGVGVLWGYGDDKTKLRAAADYLVNNVKELREYLV